MQGLFFGLKAAVLVIVIEAVLRVGRRALKNNVMSALAAAAFVALFVFDVPFPIVVLVAGLIGFVGGRAGVPAFLAGGGHGKVGGKQLADADSLLGEETPAHARPNLRWSLKITAVFLALWLAPVAVLYFGAGRRQRLQPDRHLLHQDGGGHLRRRLCRAGLCGAAGGRELRLADSRARCWTAWAWRRRRPGR